MCIFSSKSNTSKEKQPKALTKPATKKAVKLVLCGNAAVGALTLCKKGREENVSQS